MINRYVVYNCMKSGDALWELHLHDTYEINFMLTDGVEVMMDGNLYTSKRGDVFIFKPYVFHKVNSKGMPFKRFLMFFDSDSMCKTSPNSKRISYTTLDENGRMCVKIADI